MAVSTSEPGALSPAAQADRFIHACLRGRWLSSARGDARAIASQPAFDWSLARDVAVQQRVAPLLHAVAREWDVLPAPVAADLRQAYLQNLVRNLKILHDLDGVLGRLDAAAVPVVVLKGVALVAGIYEHEALRPMGDVDLLVRRRDIAAAVEALAAAGFTAAGSEPRPGTNLAFENEVVLWRPAGCLAPVELHWSLFDSPHYQAILPMEWFWETADRVALGGGVRLVLAPEALLLHLCGHLALHHGQGESQHILWQHDVAEVLHRHAASLDWDRVLAKAEAYDLVLSLQRVLPPVVETWQCPVPGDALRRLAALRPSTLERRLHGWLRASARSPAQRLWADLVSTRGWRSRLRFAWRNVVPSPAYMRRRYGWPRMLTPLAYPYRWFLGLAGLWPTGRGRSSRSRRAR